jgi:hypothetical protein
MVTKNWKSRTRSCLLAVLLVAALLLPAGATVHSGGGRWWEVPPEPYQAPLSDGGYLYTQIAPRLHEIEMASNRVRVDVMGQSAGGRNLYLVTISAPEAMGRLGQYQAIRQAMLRDPEHAQELIDQFGDFKVPFFINASIHGAEVTGVDASMRLIETLATSNTPEVQMILDNLIVLINVVQNPDGRVLGQRGNANGIDINRDFITQSQPESRATVKVFTEWNPMVVLDLHGYVSPMLIEPCTPPHNPNYEYDLYIQWALQEAEAMEAELFAQTGYLAQIPYRDQPLQWDDWPPTYAPMYAMFHGAYGHTMETPYRDVRGVNAHYAAVWGGLKFAAQHRVDMVHDQIEVFKRGFLDLPQQPIPEEWLPLYPQYQELIPNHFPAAYVIPADAPFQLSPQAPARLVDFLLYNDVEVEQASQPFTVDGVEYPAGSYIVWLNQPKRGLANTILSDGLDLSSIPGLEFYSQPTVWSHPLLWGVYRAVMEDPVAVATHPVNNADPPQGSVEGGGAGAFAYLPTSIAAIQATNDLLARGVAVLRVPGQFVDRGRSFDAGVFVLNATSPGAQVIANELASRWGLDVLALDGVPAGAIALRQQRIAVYVSDAGAAGFLTRFGFAFDVINQGWLNDAGKPPLTDYDVFINTSVHMTTNGLGRTGKAKLANYFAAGKDYIGIGSTGARLVGPGHGQLHLFPFTYTGYAGSLDSIVRVDYNTADPVGAGFGMAGYAFVNNPQTFAGLGADVQIAAAIANDQFLVSGYWPNWAASGAAGQPIVIRWAGGVQDVTLIGLDPIFRGHPEDSFRIVANAIFAGVD